MPTCNDSVLSEPFGLEWGQYKAQSWLTRIEFVCLTSQFVWDSTGGSVLEALRSERHPDLALHNEACCCLDRLVCLK
jgi:hypothetical protein